MLCVTLRLANGSSIAYFDHQKKDIVGFSTTSNTLRFSRPSNGHVQSGQEVWLKKRRDCDSKVAEAHGYHDDKYQEQRSGFQSAERSIKPQKPHSKMPKHKSDKRSFSFYREPKICYC